MGRIQCPKALWTKYSAWKKDTASGAKKTCDICNPECIKEIQKLKNYNFKMACPRNTLGGRNFHVSR